VPELQDQLQVALADRYAIEREVGRGGMATVYLARDLRHRRPVAVKILHPHLAAHVGPDRFQREVEIAARMTHPHILTLIDSGEVDGFLYYVMPFIEGSRCVAGWRASGSSRSRTRWRSPVTWPPR
jgi:serine/threonine protein kinase